MSAVANRQVKWHSLRSKKCTSYEIESIIKSLVNSNLDLDPLKKKKCLYAEELPASDLRAISTALFTR